MGDALRSLRLDYAGVQAVARIRGTYPAGPFIAIQRLGVGAQLLEPERVLEVLAQCLGVVLQLIGLGTVA